MSEDNKPKIRKFQWIKGDNVGSVETFKNQEGQWINFEGGGRINASLLSEFLFELKDGDTALNLEAKEVNVESAHVDPNPLIKAPSESPIKPQLSNNSKSPLRILLDKHIEKRADEEDCDELNISIGIKLPPKVLYSILNTSFEDVDKELTQYVLEHLYADNFLEDCVTKSLKEFYE